LGLLLVLLAPTVEHLVEEAKLGRDDACQGKEKHCEHAHGVVALVGGGLFSGAFRRPATGLLSSVLSCVVLSVSSNEWSCCRMESGIWNLELDLLATLGRLVLLGGIEGRGSYLIVRQVVC
jgi:hypothetical protein